MPGSSVMVRNAFPPALAPTLKHIFIHWTDLKEHQPQYPHYMNETTSDRAYEIAWEISGTAPMPLLTEGSAPATDGLISGGTKKVVHLEYGLLSEVTKQLVDDDLYHIFINMPGAHAASGLFAREAACCSLFNLGGTSVTTTNGATLFNTAQPLMGGVSATSIAPNISTIINSPGTYPNRPNPDADLTMTSLQQAITMFALQPNDRGIPVHVKPKYLVHAVQQRRNVRELLGSPGVPGSSNNELNWVQAEGLVGLELNYLSTPNGWGLIADKMGHQMYFYERKALQAATDDDFKTQVLLFRSNQRFGVVANSWRGTFFSYGA